MSTRAEVLKAREDFRAGACWAGMPLPSRLDAALRRRYPLPKVEQPRILELNGIRFALIDGELLHSWDSTTFPHWDTAATIADPDGIGGAGCPDHKRLIAGAFEAYAELKANPTELVEDDA